MWMLGEHATSRWRWRSRQKLIAGITDAKDWRCARVSGVCVCAQVGAEGRKASDARDEAYIGASVSSKSVHRCWIRNSS